MRKDIQVIEDLMATMEEKDLPEIKAQTDTMESKAHKDHKVQKDHKAHKVLRALRDLRDQKVLMELMVTKAQRE